MIIKVLFPDSELGKGQKPYQMDSHQKHVIKLCKSFLRTCCAQVSIYHQFSHLHQILINFMELLNWKFTDFPQSTPCRTCEKTLQQLLMKCLSIVCTCKSKGPMSQLVKAKRSRKVVCAKYKARFPMDQSKHKNVDSRLNSVSVECFASIKTNPVASFLSALFGLDCKLIGLANDF